LIEAKLSDENPSKNFYLFSKDLPDVQKIHLVKNLKREKTFPNGIEMRSPGSWLSS
jgi:hypothetical protein